MKIIFKTYLERERAPHHRILEVLINFPKNIYNQGNNPIT